MTTPSRTFLKRLNSATKYPSILTYHEMGERGRLKDSVQISFSNEDNLIATEKIDGTNARMIFLPRGDFIIGSREELLHYSEDWIHNPSMGIADAIKPIANKIATPSNDAMVIYGEVYGGKVTAGSKNYTGNKTVGFRAFDVADYNAESLSELLSKDLPEISSWRENGGQTFFDENLLQKATMLGDGLQLTPRLEITSPPPIGIKETYEWMLSILPEDTFAALDDKAKGKPEGIVLRTHDRSKIAKFRFEDYERTLNK